jgi:hypothetical protein
LTGKAGQKLIRAESPVPAAGGDAPILLRIKSPMCILAAHKKLFAFFEGCGIIRKIFF